MSNKPSNTKLSLDRDEQKETSPENDEETGTIKQMSAVNSATTGGDSLQADGAHSSRQASASPTAHRSITTSEKINLMHSSVTIEDIGTDSPNVTRSTSNTGEVGYTSALPDQNVTGCTTSSNNNNNLALIPVPQITSKTSQMIPLALLRKSSNGTPTEECSGIAGAGIMHIITGSNKVAPADAACSLESNPTTVGAVLMLIPKKSDCVCVDISAADLENNPAMESQGLEQHADPNCQSGSNQQDTIVRPTQSYDSYEEVCRICHDNPSKMELISPCLCKGSMSKVHRACLERWLAESAKNSCEICNYEYNTVRKPKYKGCRSVYQWMRNPLSPSDMRNLFFDIACFFILTPLAAISSWLCVVGAQHYTFGEERRRRAKFRNEASSLWDVHGQDPRADASNATWTSVGLLSLTATLLVAYSVWLFVAIKYHIQAWREWQQRNYTVTIVPFEDGCMGRPPPPRPPRNQSNNNNNGSLLGGSDNGHNSIYNFDANPNLLRYSGHNSLIRGARGRNLFRQARSRRQYNLPPIFSRSHFLRNPPPGYTISETTLLYQALYGSDSDAYLNENFLAFFADSSDDVTESTSPIATECPVPTILSPETLLQEQCQQSSNDNPSDAASDPEDSNVQENESTGFATAVEVEFPVCSSSVNNNPLLNGNASSTVKEVGGSSISHVTQAKQGPSSDIGGNNPVDVPIHRAHFENNDDQQNAQGKLSP